MVVRDPLLESMFNAPSDSDGDLPLAIQNFLRDSLKTTPDVLDNDHAVPLDYERFVIGSVFPFEVIMFLERIFVH